MKSFAKKAILLLSVGVFCLAQANTDKKVEINNYLSSPSGEYHVGFQDFHWINLDACPNKYLTDANKSDFSEGNKDYCNEMTIRIYYPTHEVGSSLYDPRRYIKETIKQYAPKKPIAGERDIDGLISYSKKNARVADGKFPVILFSSGYGMLPQSYENILLNLVSYGYVVIGINSEFINGPMKLGKHKSVDTILPVEDEQKKNLFVVSEEDLGYVYKKIKDKQLGDNLVNSMDTNHIGLLGHSLGATAVAHVAEKEDIQAVATLDLAWDNIYVNTCHRKFDAPFLELFSSFVYFENKTGDFPYLCANQPLRKAHEVIVLGNKFDPGQKNYSVHMSFTDQATLRYLPAMQAIMAVANANPGKRFAELGNGWSITNTINVNLLLFYNEHLK